MADYSTAMDGFSSNETLMVAFGEYPSTRFYTNGLLAGIFITLGIGANIIVITSWLCDRGRWLPLYYYFLAFASWNLTLLISTLFFYSLPALLRQPADHSSLVCVPYFYIIGYAGANCCLTAVVWLMVVLTIERYVAVTRPFHTRISSPRRRAKLISATLSLAAVLYNIPLTFELAINKTELEVTVEFPVANSIVRDFGNSETELMNFWKVETAPFRSNFYYQTIYRVVGHLLFISLVPFIIISTLTMKIVVVVRRTNRERVLYQRAMVPSTVTNQTSPKYSTSTCADNALSPSLNNRRRSSYTIQTPSTAAATYGNILLTVFVVKFLICYTLPFALNVLELLVPNLFQTSEVMWVTDLSDFLVILDSVSNAFLYFSWRRRTSFYKKRAMPTSSQDNGGAATENLIVRSNGCSPCTSFTRQTQCQRHFSSPNVEHQLLITLRSSKRCRYGGTDGTEKTRAFATKSIPPTYFLKAERV